MSRDQDCISPAQHSAFSTPVEMMQFIQQLRDLSGGKPVGFKLCIGQPWQFMSIVKAMLQTKIIPDFIVVDGSEGGTGAAPVELINHVGTPLREGLLFVHNTLVGAGLRDRIRVGAGGKLVSAFDIASTMAIGAGPGQLSPWLYVCRRLYSGTELPYQSMPCWSSHTGQGKTESASCSNQSRSGLSLSQEYPACPF